MDLDVIMASTYGSFNEEISTTNGVDDVLLVSAVAYLM